MFPIALAFVGLFTVGCSVQKEAEKTVIVTEDVERESSLADSSLKITRLDDVLGQENGLYEGFRKGFWGEEIYYSEDNQFFVFDVKTGTEKMLIDEDNKEFFRVSASADYALSYERKTLDKESLDIEIAVHNLKNGKTFPLTHGFLDEATYDFANAEGNEIASFNDKTNTVTLENVETNKVKTWNMNGFDYTSAFYVKKVENDLFLLASSEKDGYGVYQLKDQGKIEHITHISGIGAGLHPLEVNFLKNNTMLFNGQVDTKSGVFLLDLATGHLEALVPEGVDIEDEWPSFPAYNLSPDESKIIFSTSVQVGDAYKSNVYIGEIADGKLVNTIKMLEHTDLYAGTPISGSGSWSKDSKTVYIETVGENEMNLETIAVFEVE